MIALRGYTKAVVSGRAAAALWGFTGFGACRPEITVPPGVNSRGSYAIVHRSANAKWTRLGPLRVVRPEQAIIEIAGGLSAKKLGAIVDDALRGPLRLERLAGRYAAVAHTKLPGKAAIRKVLEIRDSDGYVPPDSELERLLYDFLDRPNMPEYVRQASPPWRSSAPERVDALLLPAPVIIEADGRRWHTRVLDFPHDLRRNNLAAANGHYVLRFGWEDLSGDVSYERSLVRQTVESSRTGATPVDCAVDPVQTDQMRNVATTARSG